MTPSYSADQPQREPEPGQDVFFALSQLKPGFWKIRSTIAGWISNDLAKRGGWVHVTQDITPKGEHTSTSLIWTTHKDTHNRGEGPARSITLDRAGRLMFYATSALTMHKRWGRRTLGNHKVGDTDYQEAQEVAGALFQAIITEQRATFFPDEAAKPSATVIKPDQVQPTPQDSRRKPRGP